MKFAHFLGKINSTIFLTIFYFLIFGVIALIRKVFRRRKVVNESYWADKSGEGDFEKQF